MVLGGFWPPGTLTTPFFAHFGPFGGPEEAQRWLRQNALKTMFLTTFCLFWQLLWYSGGFLSVSIVFYDGFLHILSINIAFLVQTTGFYAHFTVLGPLGGFLGAWRARYSQKIDFSGPKNDLPDLFYFLFPLLWRVFWWKNELNRSRLARVMTPTRFQNVRGP